MSRRSLVRVPPGWSFGIALVVLLAGLKAQEPAATQDGAPAGPFVRDRSKKAFHRPACPALKRVSPSLRTEVPDLTAASAMSYKPCPICKPDEAAAPATGPDTGTSGKPAPGGSGKAARPAGNEDGASGPFAREIAPILVGNCIGCHNAKAGARRNNFNLTTFAGLMKGGDSGPPIVPGDPAGSLLIHRVTGDGVRKMPPNQRDLAEATIARLASWIQGGAKLDEGLDPDAELKAYAAKPDEIRRGELARKKPEELDRQTTETGLSRWKKASSSAPTVTPGGRFLLFGKLPPERAKAVLKVMDAQVNPLRGLLQGVPSAAGILAGPEKVSLYVFNDDNGYIAFVRANENREVEAGDRAHARLDVESPYLAAVDPLKGGDEPKAASARKAARGRRGGEEPGGPGRSLAGLLAEQLAAGAVSTSGQSPRWLSLGLGAYMASQVEPRSAYYRGLRSEVADLYVQGWMTRTRELLAGEGEADRIRAVGFSLLEFLGLTNRAFVPYFLHEIVKDPKQFDTIIQQALEATPDQFFQAWGSFVASRYPRGR
jgi:hypothetical protein